MSITVLTSALLVLGLVSPNGGFHVENERATSPKAANFEADFLKAHNDYRARHGVGPLTWSATLNAQAQKWADYLAQTDSFVHSSSGYGENLYSGWSSVASFTVNGNTPVTNWYSEIANYDFATGKSKGGVIGHFTQVVWKNSKEVGVGIARSASNWIYVVANYNPAGNYVGKYIENVLPVKAV